MRGLSRRKLAGVKRTPGRGPHAGRRTSVDAVSPGDRVRRRSGGQVGEEVSGASWRWAWAWNLGGKAEVSEEPADDLGVLDSRDRSARVGGRGQGPAPRSAQSSARALSP